MTTRKVTKLGVILVNNRGLTLYMFVRDHQKRVTCTSKACVTVWPPLKIKKGQSPTAGGAAKKKLLGVDKSPAGYRVVTYKHWPLYTSDKISSKIMPYTLPFTWGARTYVMGIVNVTPDSFSGDGLDGGGAESRKQTKH